jgi:LAGLIDADG endonuclease
MGAVYALFAAWYFWSPKFDGLTYNDTKGKIHFWGMFIGVKEKLAPSLVFLIPAVYRGVYKVDWLILSLLRGRSGSLLGPVLNEILFDTRNSFLVLNNKYLNYIKDNYSINLLYFSAFCTKYQFKFYKYLFKFFILTKNYPNAQLVEVKDSVNVNPSLSLKVAVLNIRPPHLKGRSDITEIQKASQRLNTKDIQWLVGFTDGDGCLTMYKEKKRLNNWRHEYTIGLSIKDIRLLYKIKDILGCGVIRKYNNVAIFNVKKIKHLIYIIIPLFDKYPLLTDKKRVVYLNFRSSLLQKALISKRNITSDDILFIKQLLTNTPSNLYKMPVENSFKKIEDNFFDNWLVGFTEAEGSFYFIKKKLSNKDNILQPETPLRAEFRISQNNNLFLLNKIKEKLKITRKVSLQSNSSNHYYVLAGSNLSIQNVINFYTNPNLVKFKGLKYLQFILWLKGIKNVVRHNNINIPVNYGGDTS